MTKIVKKKMIAPTADSNPFATMGLVKFWLISALFYLTFPISLVICFVVLRPRRTRQLITALVHDFSVSYTFEDSLEVYGGINNAFEEDPYLGTLSRPAGPRGRFFYLGVNYTM